MNLMQQVLATLILLFVMARDAFQAKLHAATCLGLWGITCLLIVVIIALVICARDKGE